MQQALNQLPIYVRLSIALLVSGIVFVANASVAQAQIVLDGTASGNTNNVASTSIDVSGAGIDDGDLILFMGAADGAGWDMPSGFTEIDRVDPNASSDVVLGYRVASSEPTSYTVENSGSAGERSIAIFAVYSGVDTLGPIGVSTSTINTGTSITMPSLTPENNDSAVIVFVGAESGNAGNPVATGFPATVTERLDNVNGPTGTGSGSAAGAFGDVIQTSAATVSGSVTWSESTNLGLIAVALNPDTGGGATGGPVTLSGTLFQNDGTTAITTGETITVASVSNISTTTNTFSTTTDGSGNFSFGLPEYRATSSIEGWATTTAAGDDDFWLDVVYGDNLYVAVGDTGDRVMTSPDGVTWSTTTAAGDDDGWWGIAYGNNTYVAVGRSGDDRVMTSPDGVTWTAQSAAGDNDEWYDVTYGNGLFVAVGDGAGSTDRVMTSPDGVTWTVQSAAGNNDAWQAVTYGNGLFVAVSEVNDRVMTSPDGVTWTVQSAAGNNDTWLDVTYGNGLFVAVGLGSGGDVVMTSPDGVTWTVQSAAGNNDSWTSVAYGDGLFVAAGTTFGSADDLIMTSPDGVTWTAQSAADDDDFWFGLAYGDGRFIVVNGSTGDKVIYADVIPFFNEETPLTLFVDGSTTTSATTLTFLNGATTISGIDLAADAVRFDHASTTGDINLASSTVFFDASDDADVLLDVSGATTSIGSGIAPADMEVRSGTTFTPTSELVIWGDFIQNGAFRTGSGTTTFSGANKTATGTLTGLDQLGDIAIDPGSLGQIWATTTAVDDNDVWEDIIYGESQFVAVGRSGDRVMTSPDGITWTAQSAAGDNDDWYAVTYGDGLYVAVGDASGSGDAVMTSPDGITWTAQSAAGDNDSWTSVTHGAGLFVAVGTGPDRVMTSSDGITWATTSAAGDNDDWQSVVYGDNQFVAVGQAGDRIMTSPDGITWTVQTAVSGNWVDVAYGNGLYVAVAPLGANRTITSPDGVTWTDADEIVFFGDNVTHANDTFVIVGKDASSIDGVLTSATGSDWVFYEATESTTTWDGIASDGEKFVAVASFTTADHRVMYSTDGVFGFDAPASTSDVFIEASKELVSSSTLDVSGYFTNEGTLSNNGLLRFTGPGESELTLGTAASAAIGEVEIASDTTFNSSATTSALTVTSSGDLNPGSALEVQGDFTQNGSINFNGTTLYLSSGSTTVSGTLSGSNDLNDVVIGSPSEVGLLPQEGGGDGSIVITAGENTDTFPSYGYNDGANGDPVYGSIANTSSLTVNGIAVINAGSWFGVVSVPDTSPTLTSVSVDGTPYALSFGSNSGGIDTYSFTPGSQIFVTGTDYDIVFTDDMSNEYGGGAAVLGVGDTVTFVDATEVADIEITRSRILEIGDTLTVNGDYTNNGQFNASTSAVVFDGVALQTATGTLSATSSFYDLTISSLASLNGDLFQSVTFGAPLTVTNDFVMNPGTSAAFLAGATSTLQNVNLQGSGGNLIFLRSTTDGSTWGLDVPGSQISLSFIDVQDSVSAQTATATNSVDSGNNTNWAFESSGGGGGGGISFLGGASNEAAFSAPSVSLTGLSLQENDLVLVTNIKPSDSDITTGVTTSGYTEITELYADNTALFPEPTDTNLSVSYKFMSSSPDSSVSCEGTGDFGSGSICVVQAFRGVDTSTPFDASATESISSTAIPDPAAITPESAGAWVVVAGGSGSVSDASVTPPTGYSNQTEETTDYSTYDTIGAMASKEWSGSGSEDPGAWTDWQSGTGPSSAAVTIALRPGTGGGATWNSANWTMFDPITIDAANIDEDLTDFPVYVDLADLSSNFWSTTPTSADLVGTDIRVTTTGGIELPRELVYASSTTQTGELHFRADNISSTTDTTFRIWYNGDTNGDYATTSTYGTQNVWTNGFVGVYHFQEDPSLGTATIIDSSGAGTNASSSGAMTSSDRVAAQVGSGYAFDGGDDYLRVANNAALDLVNNGDWTASMWVNRSSAETGISNLIQQTDSSGTGRNLMSVESSSCTTDELGSFIGGAISCSGFTVTDNTWQRVAVNVTENGASDEIVFNLGSATSSVSTQNSESNDGADWLFGVNKNLDSFFTGELDEVRLSSGLRTKAWHDAEFLNQSTATDFYTIGATVDGDDTGGEITFLGSASATGTNSAVAVDLASLSLVEGDLVVVTNMISAQSDLDASIVTSGYTELFELYSDQTNGGAGAQDANFSASWKLMGAIPDTSVSCAPSDSSINPSVCVVQAFRGANQVSPIGEVNNSILSTFQVNSPEITPQTTNAWVLVVSGTAGTAAPSATPPAGYSNTEVAAVDGSRDATVGMTSKVWAGGVEDPDAWTDWTVSFSGSVDSATMELRPGPATAPSLGTGTSTISDHDAGQVDDAFNFQNKTNEELFAFRLAPDTGTATITDIALSLTAVDDIVPADFSNIRLLLDVDNDAEYDATDTVLDSSGQLTVDTQTNTGSFTFSLGYGVALGQNYLVVADWDAPDRSAFMTINLFPSGVTSIDDTGTQTILGSVDGVQHARTDARGAGGAASLDIGSAPPAGSGDIGGGGATGGEEIGNDPNFNLPTADTGTWVTGSNAYDGVDGTYASVIGSGNITYVGGVSDAVAGTSAITLDLSGLSLLEDDLVIVSHMYAIANNSTAYSPGVVTSGYTETNDLFVDRSGFAADTMLSVNYKVMGSSPDSSVVCQAATESEIAAVCIAQAFRGVDTATPLDVSTTENTSTSAGAPNPPSITPVTSDATIVIVGAAGQENPDSTVTVPSGYSNQVSNTVNSFGAAVLAMASKAAVSGAEDPAEWTAWQTGSLQTSAAVTLALRPAAGGGDEQVYRDHGFAVNSGANIDGIEVKLETSGTLDVGTINVELSWDGGSSWTSSQSTPTLTASDTVISLGGSDDLWGRSWSVSEFSDSNFRVRLTGLTVGNTVQVDEIQVRVYSSVSGGGSGGGADI